MQIFIAGICGTFMAGIALLARAIGIQVRGCDANVYPPMSEQLRAAGIEVLQGYDPSHLMPHPDAVVVGNALSRGNPLIEHMLDAGIPYTSGPQWLWEQVLRDRHVIAVSGTHGKTTTSSMLAWILHDAGLEPGYLVGGIPSDFGLSARIGRSKLFVIEADEYDTAFFDKRSKFVHYRPRTLVINNIEFDHADIFPDLAAIERQFHHLVRTVPASGSVIHPLGDASVQRVLDLGLWSRPVTFAVDDRQADWLAVLQRADASELRIDRRDGSRSACLSWSHRGRHNAANAVAAVAAADQIDVPLDRSIAALARFSGVKRRMERVGHVAGVTVYDDFAHHPSAIKTTLAGLRAAKDEGRIVAVIESRSNTMRLGAHRATLPDAVRDADRVFWYQPPGVDWDIGSVAALGVAPSSVHASTAEIIDRLVSERRVGDRIVIMSNGGFEAIHQRLVRALEEAAGSPGLKH